MSAPPTDIRLQEAGVMGTLFGTLEKHHRLIIGVQAFLLAFFVLACTFHDVIPVCHYLFGCDHGMH